MTPDDFNSVLVNFEIDHRELFRASMDLAKWRFLIGIVVVIVLGVLLSCFFIMIDERTILLQMSPLFIGAPLVSLAGQVLRLHAMARKYVSGLSPSQRQVQYQFQANSDGYDSSAGGSFSHIVWSDVKNVVEKSRYFLVHLNSVQVSIIPKRGFRSSDIPVFREILLFRLGNRAKLTSG